MAVIRPRQRVTDLPQIWLSECQEVTSSAKQTARPWGPARGSWCKSTTGRHWGKEEPSETRAIWAAINEEGLDRRATNDIAGHNRCGAEQIPYVCSTILEFIAQAQTDASLLTQAEIAKLRAPRPRAVKAYRSYLNGTGPEDKLVYGKAQSMLDDEQDLVAIHTPTDIDILSTLLQDQWPRTVRMSIECIQVLTKAVCKTSSSPWRDYSLLSRSKGAESRRNHQHPCRFDPHHRSRRRLIQITEPAWSRPTWIHRSVHCAVFDKPRASDEREASRDLCSNSRIRCRSSGLRIRRSGEQRE